MNKLKIALGPQIYKDLALYKLKNQWYNMMKVKLFVKQSKVKSIAQILKGI